MTTPELVQLYEREIKPLPLAQRLHLLALLSQDLVATVPMEISERSILELRGLGKEIWQGIDAQQYVNELRDEWDRPQ